MLHRILPNNLIQRYGANPEWTMTPEVLTHLIRFLKEHYNPVSADQVEQHVRDDQPLPPRALLLTFDDGWRDNHEFAKQVLLNENMPAIIFVVSETINQHMPFWQELIYSCCTERVHLTHCLQLAELDQTHNTLSLIHELSRNPAKSEAKQKIIIYCHEQRKTLPRQLLSEDELVDLFRNGIEIGSHGATHNRLGDMTEEQQAEELSLSRNRLISLLESEVRYLSFPHGSHNEKTRDLTLASGYTLMFNSNVHLNQTDSMRDNLGRIHVSQESITNVGNFSPFKTSYSLFFAAHD